MMEGSATQEESDFLARFVSRAALLAYQANLEEWNLDRILEADGQDNTNTGGLQRKVDGALICRLWRL